MFGRLHRRISRRLHSWLDSRTSCWLIQRHSERLNSFVGWFVGTLVLHGWNMRRKLCWLTKRLPRWPFRWLSGWLSHWLSSWMNKRLDSWRYNRKSGGSSQWLMTPRGSSRLPTWMANGILRWWDTMPGRWLSCWLKGKSLQWTERRLGAGKL